jgi:hypothetical protein
MRILEIKLQYIVKINNNKLVASVFILSKHSSRNDLKI